MRKIAVHANVAEDLKRLEPYLPLGSVLSDGADAVARVPGALKRALLAQRLHPGQKVPIDDIADELKLSRTPVREALRQLESEGLVRALPNRGFIVGRLDAAETAHLYDSRACVEAHVAATAFARRNGTFLRDLRALHVTYTRVLSGAPSQRRLGMLADKAFHLRIAEQAGNPFLTCLLANVFDRLIFTRPLDGFPPARMAEAVEEHAAIVDAFVGGSGAKVRDAIARNIRNGGNAVVAYLRLLESGGITL